MVENRDFAYTTCIRRPRWGSSRRNTAVWCGKLEWCYCPMVKKIENIYLFVSTEYTNVTDRRTDRQTHGRTDRHRTTA